jgi:hypothetical protein
MKEIRIDNTNSLFNEWKDKQNHYSHLFSYCGVILNSDLKRRK